MDFVSVLRHVYTSMSDFLLILPDRITTIGTSAQCGAKSLSDLLGINLMSHLREMSNESVKNQTIWLGVLNRLFVSSAVYRQIRRRCMISRNLFLMLPIDEKRHASTSLDE